MRAWWPSFQGLGWETGLLARYLATPAAEYRRKQVVAHRPLLDDGEGVLAGQFVTSTCQQGSRV